MTAQQKLVSIVLNRGFSVEHGSVSQHLEQELGEGWQIKSVNLSAADSMGWIVVLLEKRTGN